MFTRCASDGIPTGAPTLDSGRADLTDRIRDHHTTDLHHGVLQSAMPASRGRHVICNAWNESMAQAAQESFQSCVSPVLVESDRSLSRMLLVNGSSHLSTIVERLLFAYPVQVCECTSHLENAASCGETSAAKKVREVYRPWCFMVAHCEGMATSLLRSAAICQTAGMSGSNETVLCRDPNCAKSVEDLFSSTHRSEWRNVSKLLEDLRVPSFTRRLDAQDVISAVDEGERRVTEDIDMPSYFFRDGLYSLGQLSACMLRVKVREDGGSTIPLCPVT